MAEAALFGITKSILQQLGSPALDEFRLLWAHKEQLEKLEDTVTTIRNVLQDADRKQATDASVQGWIARLRVVLYEADDLFDAISAKYLLEKAKKGTEIGQKVRCFVSKPYRFASFVKNAHKVKEIRERFDDIAADINKFNFLPITTELDPPSRIQPREETHSFVLRNEVVGREEETEEVVRMLLSEQINSSISVIAVIGIGGLGKTTLAKLVNNDERVQKGFDLYIWACINYFSTLKEVLKTLLKSIPLLQFTKMSELSDLNLEKLQSSFRKEIEGKRFLLVLDDLWDEDPLKWGELKQLLSNGKEGSKILTTTRSEIVAQSMCATKPYFHLQGMSDESAWLLFKKFALGEEGDQNSLELEQFGRQIVRKCANVPLAIITIARLLRGKEKERWFRHVNNELSIVFPDDHRKIMHTLEISYKELPYPIKRCFGYCSLFPKDFKFEKGYLVSLWIAQGFIEPLNQCVDEDIAEEYFSCLVDRCFFQLSTGSEEKESIVTYQMHDLMHDLATKVARSESILVDNIPEGSWDKNIRHVSINCDLESMVKHVCSFSHSKSLRTFLYPYKSYTEKKYLKKLMLSFKSLRVLDLSRSSEGPINIGELIHLRFLDLSNKHDLKRLPSSICNLPHLQSLILRNCSSLEELPEDLGKLISLRHLVLQYCYRLVKMPPGLAALTSLITLDRLVVHNPSGGLQYLEGLNNLTGSLQIELPSTEWESATKDAEQSSLSKKTRLDSLAIIFKNEQATELDALELPPNLVELSIKDFGGKEIPDGVSSLHKLVILRLNGCKSCVKLPPLSHLPSLKELCIYDMDSMLTIEESKSYGPNSFFPSLETLSIEDMGNLTGWWLQAPTVLPTFPRLTKVSIKVCEELTRCLPLFPLIENLELECVREEIIWQIIGSEATSSSTHHSNSVLTKLKIRECGLLSIEEAQIRHLSTLQDLCIVCSSLESIALNGLAYLTSLEHLEIHKGGGINWGGQEEEVRRIHLPRVRHLEIPTMNRKIFEGLKDMASLEALRIESTFTEELQEEDEEEGLQWKRLQKLRHVRLEFGERFSMRNNQRLLHGFQDLTSLKELKLYRCKELHLSFRALLCLPHLERVLFDKVEEVVDIDSDVTMIQTLPISRSIRKVWIYDSSGEWVHGMPWQSLPSLQELRLWRLNLKSLPEGIQHLSALEALSIIDNPGVASLPHWMTSLSSLEYFEARGCSEELKNRCNRLTGEDWPNIQHIETIKIARAGIDVTSIFLCYKSGIS